MIGGLRGKIGALLARLPAWAQAALLLFALAGGGALAVEFAHRGARERIYAADAARLARRLDEALAGIEYDNNPAAARFSIADLRTANARGVAGYPARRGGEIVAVVARVIAPRGYGGEIDLLVGVSPDLRLRGIFVLRHRETPGLGDFIVDRAWRETLSGLSAEEAESADAATGATITANAVLRAARDVLEYAARRGWFNGSAG